MPFAVPSRIATSCFALSMVAAPDLAAAPFTANFSGQIAPGTTNVRAPFVGVLTQGDPISGHFLFDTSVPVPAAGQFNLFFSSIPDIQTVDPSTAFHLDLGGGVTFDLDDAFAGNAAIRYVNGAFGGFFFVSDFDFGGNDYRFRSEGPTWNIRLLANGAPTGRNLVSGSFLVGDANLTGVAPYSPAQPVPEPASLALLGTGLFAAVAGARRKRKNRKTRCACFSQ